MKKTTVKKPVEPRVVTLIIPVNVHEEYSDNDPTEAKIKLSPELITRIRHLSQVVKDNEVNFVAVTDYSPEFFQREDEESEATEWSDRAECMKLFVKDDCFFWAGLVKGTDWNLETESYSLKNLDKDIRKIIRFEKRPVGDMPMFQNDKDEDIREIALRRMAEGV